MFKYRATTSGSRTTIKRKRWVEPMQKINRYKEVIPLVMPFVLVLLGDADHKRAGGNQVLYSDM